MNSEIEYQGRKARRAGSEQRRKAILEAALRIIVRDGIRNVRHRAVAREADVPLSATTYYFKDISDLIADSFTLFAEQAMTNVIEPFRQQAFQLLDQLGEGLPSGAAREQLLDQLGVMTAGFILNEVREQREHLIAEQAFMHEAVLDERLRALAVAYNRSQVEVLEKACAKLGSPDPVMDAEMMMAMVLRYEYLLLLDPDALPETELQKRVRAALALLVGTAGE